MAEPQNDATPRRSLAPAAALAAVVALLLQFSAFSKVATADKRKTIPFPDEWGLKIVEHWAVGALEMLIVIGVLLGYRWKRTWQVTGVFFGGLAGYAAWALIRNIDCGCFGELVTLPRGFSFVMDLCFLIASLAIAAWLGVRKAGLIAALIVAILAGGLGFAYAEWSYKDPKEFLTNPPPELHADPSDLPAQAQAQDTEQPKVSTAETPSANAAWWSPGGHMIDTEALPAAKTLVETNPLTQPVRAGDELQTWYVFLHDPDCHICEQVLPDVEDAMARNEGVEYPALRYLEIPMPLLEADYQIPYWAWPSTPTVLLLRAGKILEIHSGEDVLYEVLPTQVEQRVLNGEL